MNMAKKLRKLLEEPGLIMAPGAYDAISAKLIEKAGFDVVYLSGGGSAGSLGYPDFGLRTLTEKVIQLEGICHDLNIPLIADGEAGYGSAIHVMRMIREFEKAGAAGVHIEDQDLPRRCGHIGGKKLVSKEEFVNKIKAAVDSRRDPNFLLISRIDAIAVEGFERAIERANAYIEAGIDVVFFEAIENIEQMEKLPKIINKPLLINLVEGGKTPFLNSKDLENMGYKIAIYPSSALFAAVNAINRILKELKTTGTTNGMKDEISTFEFVYKDLLGWNRAMELIEKYSA
jgi:carboxyvinyl-carboxyphosphonate phosphorylmutase